MIAAVVAGLFLLGDWILHAGSGLMRTTTGTAGRDVLDRAHVRAVDTQGLDGAFGRSGGIAVTWTGAWNLPDAGVYDVALDSRGRSAWTIDGQLACEGGSGADQGSRRTVWLTAGFHRVDITYAPDSATPHLVVAAARTGQPLEPLDARALRTEPPGSPRLRRAAVLLHRALGGLLLVVVILALRRTLPGVVGRWRRPLAGPDADGSGADSAPAARRSVRRERIGKTLALTMLVVIVSYGALLRLDAITAKFGPVASPRWLSALQTRTFAPPDAVRPRTFVWQPAPLFPHQDGPPTHYISDPYTYLRYGREMRSFYAAHYREPVFPFATGVFLRFLDGQDVAVSFASASFSILAICCAYLLGAAVWSRPVGLAVALGLAFDYDAISLASAGWRDDAFVAAVVLCAYLMLRFWRAAGRPARIVHWIPGRIDAAYLEALMLGVAAGLAVLVRLFAMSFLLPGAVVLLLTLRTAWRRRLSLVGLAVVTAAAVAGPYFINCWRVYGDPLYSFNVHGDVYRVAEGQRESGQGTAAYIIGKVTSRPFEMLDTIARGLTTYPFTNKWGGFDRWRPGLGRWVSWAAVAGLMLLAGSVQGRLLLLLMLMSLVPFSFTWKVDPNWRFTAHVYPILLIAAAVAMSAGLRGLRAVLMPGPTGAAGPIRGWRTPWLTGAAVAAVALSGTWLVARTLPRLVFAEMLRVREDASATVGAHDSAFLGRGWSEVVGSGSVLMRVAIGEGTLSIPLPGVDDYPATLRMDPFPRPLEDAPARLPVIEVTLNGTPIANVALNWSPDRVGAYDVILPRELVRRGSNQLSLRLRHPAVSDGVHPGLSNGDAFGLWYVRVHPPTIPATAGSSESSGQ